jgi:hypothetical protein
MNCSIGIIIDESTHEKVRFVGRNSAPAECPTCHRLFPLSMPKRESNKRWVEFFCTRTDDHPSNGEHWFEHGDIKVSWSIPADAVWIA